VTVNWIDAPGSTLGSRTDPLAFTVTAEPVAISVGFAGDVEERVYRDGVFLAPYLASTRAVNTFSLRRSGGWPSPPTVYVDEAVPALTTFWTKLLDVDFTVQPSQAIHASGVGARDSSIVIAGKTFTVRSVSNNGAYPVTAGVVTGAGLILQCDNSPWSGANIDASCVHIDYATQVPGWNAGKQTALLARFSATPLSITQDGMGVGSFNFRNQATHIGAGIYRGSGNLRFANQSGSQFSVHDIDFAAPANPDYVMAVVRTGVSAGYALQLPWGGAMPAMEDMKPLAFLDYGPTLKTAATGGGVWVACGFGKLTTMTLKRLQVLQK
jgi:hypothetical protein